MQVDKSSVYNILLASQDPHQVKQAEAELKRVESLPGFFTSVFQVATHGDVEPSIQLAAAILLKNQTNQRWEEGLNEQEKQDIRQNFMEPFVGSTGPVQSQLCLCLYHIAMLDFPERWDNLLPEIMNNLTSNEPTRIRASLLAIRQLAKRYETKSAENRGPLNEIVSQVFPLLAQLVEHLLEHQDEQSAELQKLVCKIFWSSTQTIIPPFFNESRENFDRWMHLLNCILQTEPPQSLSNMDHEDAAKSPFWKAKKWVGHIVQRFLHRFVSLVSKKSQKSPNPLAQHFIEQNASPFLTSFLKLMHNHQVPGKVRALAIEYIDTCVLPSFPAFSVIKENELHIIQNVIFCELCFNDEDQQLWEEDQQEFVRRQDGYMDLIYDPRMAAQSCLKSMASHVSVQRIAEFIIGVFNSYREQHDKPNFRAKEGALFAMGCIAQSLAKSTDIASLESVIKAHVYSDLNSPVGFIRARALWTFRKYCRYGLQDEQAFLESLGTVVQLMRDKEFPVRVQAGLTVSKIVSLDKASDVLRPILGDLLDNYFDLISEMDNSSLVECISTLVKSYQEEVAPIAVQLCAKLVDTFMRVSGVSDETDIAVDETGEDSVFAALSCLSAINTLLESVYDNKAIYAELEGVLLPLTVTCLENGYLDFMEDICTMLAFLTFGIEHITPNMWRLFPILYSLYMGFGFDYLADMLPIFDNLISRDTETFLSEPTYIEMLVRMAQKSVGDEKVSEYDLKPVLQLISVVVQHCKGRIDGSIPSFLELVVTRLGAGVEKPKVTILLLNVVADCLYYNPLLTLNVLQSLNCTQDVFSLWFNVLRNYNSTYDKKVAALGLSSIFYLQSKDMPDSVRGGLHYILPAVVSLLLEIHNAKIEQANKPEQDEEGLVVAEDRDSDDEDPEMLMALLRQHAYDPEEELEEDDDYESIIDNVDENKYFVEAFQDLASRESTLSQEIASSMTEELQGALHELLHS